MMRSQSASTERAGKSLVELVIVMGVVALLLGFVGRAMVGLFRADDRARSSLLDGRTIDKLGVLFRSDVRAAMSADLDDDGLRLHRPDAGDVLYETPPTESGRVDRVVRREDTVVARDQFSIPGSRIGFEEQGGEITIVVTRPRFVWRVSAHLAAARFRNDDAEEDR